MNHKDNYGYEERSFHMSSWRLFRLGSGSGSRPSQADYQAFVRFMDDQGPQQKYMYPNTLQWRLFIAGYFKHTTNSVFKIAQ